MTYQLNRIWKVIKNPIRIIVALGSRYMLKWIPDELYIKLFYRGLMGEKLNLNNPEKFNEKLQWLKLNDRNPLYTTLVDKYEVRKHIERTIGKEYLIPLIGVWDNFEEIDFNKLPNKFVLKCTHDSGGIVICEDKSNFNIIKAKKKINKSLKRNFYYYGREWPYKDIKPRIICEEYMVDESGTELKDYKIFCFNGKPKLIQVISERKNNHYYINHYDTDWNSLNICRKNHEVNTKTIKKPKNLEEMIKISKILSKNIPFLRVDLYIINSKVYFGEMTFFPVSGFVDFKKIEDDLLFGSWLELPSKTNY